MEHLHPAASKEAANLDGRCMVYHVRDLLKKPKTLENKGFRRCLLASLRGFEPPAYRLGGGRSIQLSYSDVWSSIIIARQKSNCNPIFNFSPVAVVRNLRRRVLYPTELRRHLGNYFQTKSTLYNTLFSWKNQVKNPLFLFFEIHNSLHPNLSFKSSPYFRLGCLTPF